MGMGKSKWEAKWVVLHVIAGSSWVCSQSVDCTSKSSLAPALWSWVVSGFRTRGSSSTHCRNGRITVKWPTEGRHQILWFHKYLTSDSISGISTTVAPRVLKSASLFTLTISDPATEHINLLCLRAVNTRFIYCCQVFGVIFWSCCYHINYS